MLGAAVLVMTLESLKITSEGIKRAQIKRIQLLPMLQLSCFMVSCLRAEEANLLAKCIERMELWTVAKFDSKSVQTNDSNLIFLAALLDVQC